LKIIKGFQSAKSILSRQNPAESYPISPALKQRIKEVFGTDDPEQAVRQIISEVRREGDAALLDYTLRIDQVKLTSLEVSKEQIASAYQNVDEKLVSALWLKKALSGTRLLSQE
jgi:histidinol dehydrogenase